MYEIKGNQEARSMQKKIERALCGKLHKIEWERFHVSHFLFKPIFWF